MTTNASYVPDNWFYLFYCVSAWLYYMCVIWHLAIIHIIFKGINYTDTKVEYLKIFNTFAVDLH